MSVLRLVSRNCHGIDTNIVGFFFCVVRHDMREKIREAGHLPPTFSVLPVLPEKINNVSTRYDDVLQRDRADSE